MSRGKFKAGDEIWDQIEKDEMGPASIAFDKNPQAMMEPQEVGSAAEVGQEGQARADHVHAGVTGVEYDGELIQGIVELLEGANIAYTFDTDERQITIAAGTEGQVLNTTRVTSDYTALTTDYTIFCDTDGGAITITLPEGDDGQTFRIVNTGSNLVTITPDGTELLVGVNSNFTLFADEALIVTFETTEGWY